MLRAVGTQLYDGATPVVLIGGQDTTVMADQMGLITGDLPEGYRYSNHNFPVYPVPGSLNSDADCKIPSNSYKEFWFKYFWMLKNSLGGAIVSGGGTLSGTSHLNHFRIQNGDAWSRDILYRAFRDHRVECDAAMHDILDMAQVNGLYLNLTTGGGGSESNGAFGTGQIFVPGTVAFNNYVQFCADFVNAYGNHPAIACFDFSNEPVNYNGDGHDLAGRSVWWDTTYGRVVRTTGTYTGYEEWEAKYLEWKDTLMINIRSKITLNPVPLLCIGGGNFTIWWATWPGHSQVDIDWEKKRTLDYAANVDITIGHSYSQAEYNDAMGWANQTMLFVNKPTYAEEYGFGEQGPPWRYSYWSWYDLKCQQYGFSQCMMVFTGMVDPAPIGTWPDQMAYPGYPIPQEQMDAATAAWVEYNLTPVTRRYSSPTSSVYGGVSFY
jgi:hypothetical protein